MISLVDSWQSDSETLSRTGRMTEIFLDYDEISMESMGYLYPGKLRLGDQMVQFKNVKTGKIVEVKVPNIDKCQFVLLANRPALKLIERNGLSYRFGPLKESVSLFFVFLAVRLPSKWGTALMMSSLQTSCLPRFVAFYTLNRFDE